MPSDNVVEIITTLEKAGIKVWLDGGWGVDALLRKQTRDHGDVDIVVQEIDLKNLRQLLEKNGYVNVDRGDTSGWNFVLGDKGGHEVDVHVVTFDTDGNGVYGPVERGINYPAYSFEGEGVVGVYPVKCLSADYQVMSHTGYEIDEDDAKDVFALCKKFSISIPKEYNLLK